MAEKIPNARSSITYSIEFEPEKQTTPPPKFVAQYMPKYKSLDEIQDEQERANFRRKVTDCMPMDVMTATGCNTSIVWPIFLCSFFIHSYHLCRVFAQVEEQNRMKRISKTEDAVKRIDKKLGSYVDMLSTTEKPTHDLKN